MQDMTLKEVCAKVGITRRMAQGYEQAGMVASSGKNKYGYLLYNEEEVEKIKMIRQYQEFGFSIKEIKVLLEASEEKYVGMMTSRLGEMKTQLCIMEENIRKVERMIDEKK